MSDEPDVKPGSQVERYVRDLRSALEGERRAVHALESARDHLDTYARDLRKLIEEGKQFASALEGSCARIVSMLLAETRIESTGHLQRMSRYVRLLCERMDVPARSAELFEQAAPLHDAGMLAVPREILVQPELPDGAARALVQNHPLLGERLFEGSPSPLLDAARQIARSHHECWDGSGYPSGLRGEEIPLCARIVKLADVYDALRSRRPYKNAFDHADAFRILFEGNERVRPRHFDPDVLEAFGRLESAFAQTFEALRDAESC
jgi:putative two-component system response regulator